MCFILWKKCLSLCTWKKWHFTLSPLVIVWEIIFSLPCSILCVLQMANMRVPLPANRPNGTSGTPPSTSMVSNWTFFSFLWKTPQILVILYWCSVSLLFLFSYLYQCPILRLKLSLLKTRCLSMKVANWYGSVWLLQLFFLEKSVLFFPAFDFPLIPLE